MDTALGIVLQSFSLLQNFGSGRLQGRMAEDLRTITEILERQFGVADPAYLFASEDLWHQPYRELPRETIVLVTGCHHYSEMFDRASAYSVKLAIDRARRRTAPALSSIVIGDIWFYRDPELSAGRVVISIGGPKVNTVTEEIRSAGDVLHRQPAWQVVRDGKRYALFGDDPADTLEASRHFMKHELPSLIAA